MNRCPIALSLLLTFAAPCVSAYALEPVPVEIHLELAAAPAGTVPEAEEVPPPSPAPTRVMIVGRGIMLKKTGDSLALGCVDEACTRLRTVFFDGKALTATFVGREFPVTELQKTLEEINRQFRYFRKNDPELKSKRVIRIVVLASAAAIGALLVPAILAPGVATEWGTAQMGVFYGFLGAVPASLYFSESKKPVLGKTGLITSAFADDKGWNWEAEPRKVSKSTFRIYRRFAESEPLPAR